MATLIVGEKQIQDKVADPSDLAGLLKAVAAPLFLLLALTFETMAIQRIPANGGPLGIKEKDDDGKPTAEFIWQPIDSIE